MSDIVERLRRHDLFNELTDAEYQHEVVGRAADEIERLRERISMLELCGKIRLKCQLGHSWLADVAASPCPWCRIEELEECSEIDFNERDRLLKRIEELEKESEWKAMKQLLCADYHIITTEQIDAAWQRAMQKKRGEMTATYFIGVGMEAALKELGIEPCEHEWGDGEFECIDGETATTMPPTEYDSIPICPACDGHGWVKKERNVKDGIR